MPGSPNGQREELTAGDIVIFPHGDAHFLGNGSPENQWTPSRLLAKNLTEGLKVARFGGGGEITRFVCGFLACEPRLSEVFLAGLPTMLKVHVVNEPSGQWLENSIRFSVGEVSGSNAGSGLVLAKLSEVLFVETLRRYINALPPGPDRLARRRARSRHRPGSRLFCTRSPRIHGPSRIWQGASVCHVRGLLSASAIFWESPPWPIWPRWRLKLGAEILQSTEDSVAEVAAAVGYGSEAAFNRAFKREFDCPPAQFRRKRNVPPPAQRVLKMRRGA